MLPLVRANGEEWQRELRHTARGRHAVGHELNARLPLILFNENFETTMDGNSEALRDGMALMEDSSGQSTTLVEIQALTHATRHASARFADAEVQRQSNQTVSRTRMMSRYCLTTSSTRTRCVPDTTLQAYHVRLRLFHTPSWQELICRFGPKQGLFEFVWSHARSFRSSAPRDELVPRRIAACRSFDTRGSSSSSVSEGLICQYNQFENIKEYILYGPANHYDPFEDAPNNDRFI